VKRWWRSHSIRVRLTLWYVATMILVLGVYAAVIVLFVSRTASESLEGQLRRDFQLAAATIYRAPDGSLTWDEPEQIVPEQDPLWVQVWSADGRQLLFRSAEAERLPVPQSQALAAQVAAQSMTVPGEFDAIRILSRLSGFSAGSERFVIQVGRSEAPMRQELQQLVFILVLGLPLAVAVAGLGGYTLARGALLPVEQMTEREADSVRHLLLGSIVYGRGRMRKLRAVSLSAFNATASAGDAGEWSIRVEQFEEALADLCAVYGLPTAG